MRPTPLLALAFSVTLVALSADPAAAHCDALDGPVVLDARKALEDGAVEPVLKWVPQSGEDEVRAAFRRVLQVRASGGDAAALADTWFYETVVRVHRAGEGAPYTGLKPAGQPLPPAIAAADRAVHDGDGSEVRDMLVEEVRRGLNHRLGRVRGTSAHHDVDTGREHVHAYVEFVHYVERLHHAATTAAHPADPHEAH